MIFGSLANPQVQEAVEAAKKNPGRWTVYLVEGTSEPRTPAQNRMFRCLLRKLAQQHGETVEYWHEKLVRDFLGFDEVVTEDGYVRKVLPTTAALSVSEFSNFLSACLAFAADLQVH